MVSETAVVACVECDLKATFDTPYGRLCMEHTMERVYADDDLWMPQLIKAQ